MSSPQSPIIHDSSGSSGSQDIAHADLRHTELDNSGNWQYKKLDTSKSEIRLLRLPSNCQSGEAQSFKCVIDHFSLVGPPAYTALSYPWGDQHDKLPILINYDVDHTGESLGYSKTHVLRVGRNLYNALSNLAYLGYERVWADALCINQQDVEERSQQILRMDAIYRSARDVVVCLPDTGRLETHTLPLFSEMWEYESAIRLLERRSLTGDIESSQDPDEHVKLSDLIARYREPWKKNLRAIYQFFTHQYWARVWILQELAFGVKVDIVCGSQRIPFACVEKAIDIVQRLAFLKNVSGIQQVNTIIEIRAQVRSADPLRLLDILQRSYKSQSSNMLDRVYGVYGLAFDAKLHLPVPTYSAPPAIIALALTTSIIEISKRLDIVPMLGNAGHELGPSWSPNWFAPSLWSDARRRRHFLRPQSIVGPYQQRSFSWNEWKAALGGNRDACWPQWNAHRGSHAKHSIEGMTLKAQGRRIGTIHRLSTSISDSLDQKHPRPAQATKQSLSDRFADNEISKALAFVVSLVPWEDASSKSNQTLPSAPIFFEVWSQWKNTRESHQDKPETSRFRLDYREQMRQHSPMLSKWMSENQMTDLLGEDIDLRGPANWVIGSKPSWPKGESKFPWTFLAMGSFLCTFALLHFLGFMYDAFIGQGIIGVLSRQNCKHLERILALDMRLAVGDFSLGWVDRKAEIGDEIVVFKGCSVPVVLRTREKGGWTVVGDAVVYNAMKGERIAWSSEYTYYSMY